MENILAKIGKDSVRKEPLPYLVAKGILPPDLLQELIKTFPSIETITKGADLGNNKRFDYTIRDMRNDPNINPLWREFLEANASREFFTDFVRLFGEEIESRYPKLIEKHGDLLNMKHGTRYIDDHQSADILFDAHIAINTPVKSKATSVRGAHVDDPKKLFGGLLYLRPPYDKDSQGGELLIYRYKDKNKKEFFGQAIDEKYVEVVETVPYKANILVLFLNTIDSLHGVTPRMPTPYPRLFVNLVAELKEPLYDIERLQEPMWKRRIRYWKNKIPG